MSATPEFVRWALRHACVPRADASGDDVEKISRQLFVLRECGEAVRQGRVVGDFALARETIEAGRTGEVPEPCGFRIGEVLDVYGGLACVDAQCGSCPVNLPLPEEGIAGDLIARAPGKSNWARCFGIVDWRPLGESWFERVEWAQRQLAPLNQWDRCFLPTRPTWYGLWLGLSELTGGVDHASPATDSEREEERRGGANKTAAFRDDQLEWLERLWERCLAEWPAATGVMAEFLAAIRCARTGGVELRAKLFPRGEVAGKRWRVAPFCERCGYSWCDQEKARTSRLCPVCRLPAAPRPARTRAAQGSRPYGPLARVVGRQRAAELLSRYWQERGEAS